jgi:D-alanyl-D-alanine carboxypeptidase
MNNGNRRRKRRHYRVRYDRIFAVILVLIVLIVIITSCSKGCSSDDEEEQTGQSSVVDELTTGNEENAAETPAVAETPEDTTADSGLLTEAQIQYTTANVDYSQIYNGDLIVINSLHAYKFQEDDVTLETIYDNMNSFYKVKDNVTQLDATVVNQLNALMEAYAAAAGNTDLNVINGYRTLEEQNEKYTSAISTIQGGCSDYHSGRTFDIGIFPDGEDSNYYSADGDYAWFGDNAANYGFVVRFPEGKESVTGDDSRAYTFRYVGIPHAIYMKQNNLCLEEYIDQLKGYDSSNPLSITNGTTRYDVYYVAANANSVTEVPVPSNKQYSISGNNIDGFIVTVTE